MRKILILILLYCVPLIGSEAVFDISSISTPIIEAEAIIRSKKKSIPIIAIAGCSAVGKTEFTKSLQQKFQEKNITAIILRQDDFMNPAEEIPNYILHPHLDHKKLCAFLQQIKEGELHLKKPKFDWKKHAIIYEDMDLDQVDVILFEGLYALTGSEAYNLRDYSDIHIFLSADEENIVTWNWQRETSGKCSHTPRDRKKFDDDIAWDMKDYRKNVLPTKLYADFVIEKDKEHHYSLIKKIDKE